jgi:hypothetical protein
MTREEKIKPQIEEIAHEYLSGDALSDVLDFARWLRTNKMKPTFGSRSKIGISYTTSVLYVKLFYGSWQIWISGKHRKYGRAYIDDFLACDELKKVVSESLARCSEDCGHKCNEGQGYTVTVCGKTFEKVCGCCTVRFHNPSTEILETIKRVIEKRSGKEKLK